MSSTMYYFFLLVVFFSCSVVCEDCMIFNFENGLEDLYNKREICQGQDMWRLGNYSDLSMNGFHPQSSVFATTSTSLSCMSSPVFQITAEGILEFNLYLKPNVEMYQIVVMVQKYEEGNIDSNVLTEILRLTEGWQSIKIPFNITVDTFLGYVSIMAIADPSALLLDSFRYVPASMKKEECQIYKEVDVIDPEEDKKPRYSIFFMIKMGILKILN